MFISMQNTQFRTQFFLEIVQRYCILPIWGTLDMPGHSHKNDRLNLYKILALIHTNLTLSLTYFLRYRKDFEKLLLWVIWLSLAMPTVINSATF